MGDGCLPIGRKVFPGIPQVAEILALPSADRYRLFEAGIPGYFFHRRYSADRDLSVIHWDGHASFVCFGHDGGEASIGIDTANRNVILINDPYRSAEQFINSTIDHFARTVAILAEGFPYYRDDAWYEEIPAVEEGLRAAICLIDPAAIETGSYWSQFIDELDGMMFDMKEMSIWHQSRHAELSRSDAEVLDRRKSEDSDGFLF